MPKRIDRLTPEQEAAMASWADKWIARARCTDPADRETFELAARACYRHAGLAEPKIIIWVGSPMVALIAGPIAARLLGSGAVHVAVRGTVGGAVEEAVREAVRGAVDEAVSGAVDGAVRGAGGGAVYGAVDGAVQGAVGGAVDGAVSRAVGGAVYGAVDGAVSRAVDEAVSGAVGMAVDGAVRRAGGEWYCCFGGTCWLSWQAYETFLRHHCGLEISADFAQRADDYAAAQMSAGHWWLHRDFIIVSERPAEIHLEQSAPRGYGSHRLHNDHGMALRYPDGWGVYAIHGVSVPGWLVETPAEDLDPLLFAKQENAEVRREFVRKVGIERLCAKLGTTVLDKSADGMYELHAAPLGGTTGPWPYLKMRNPSIGVYHMEAVAKECRTVKAALSFRNGGEFKHLAPLT